MQRSWPVILLIALLAGCGPPSSVAPVETGRAPVSTETQSRSERIDAALTKAASYLIAAQSADGAWRSDVYGTFKEGDALTAIVVQALQNLPDSEQNRAAAEKGTRYLVNMVAGDGTIAPPRYGWAYPVYSAAGAVMVLARQNDLQLNTARDAWLRNLREQQLVESLGWEPNDAQYGGWGYAHELPRKPAAGQPLGPLAEPNLSATVFALEALRTSGASPDDPAVRKALAFVRRCQNFSDDPSAADNRLDDGGFFFIQDDPVRNKAGLVAMDPAGQERFASYGSATADGLRALLLCGLPVDAPRVVAAKTWLERHFTPDIHPGAYAPRRESVRSAPYFYYCQSLAKAFHAAGVVGLTSPSGDYRWADALADELLLRQRADGSWINTAVDIREDDPLVATTLAIMALTACGGR